MSKRNFNKKSFIFNLITGAAIIGSIVLVALVVIDKNNREKTDSSQAGKIVISENDHIRGDKNAPITLVEFSDFQCPYCKKFHPTMQKLIEEYNGQVRWIYRHFPLAFHKNAQKSAEAAECAGDQGKFWEFVDKSFENSQSDGDGLNDEDLKKYAEELNLDASEFNDCLSKGKFADKVKSDMKSGKDAGITGTPGTILINKKGGAQIISGALSYNQMKTKINNAVK